MSDSFRLAVARMNHSDRLRRAVKWLRGGITNVLIIRPGSLLPVHEPENV